MRIFIPTLLVICTALIPSLVWAQTPNLPPPPPVEDHPDVTPPTKAPTKPLPATPLPDEVKALIAASASSSEALEPGTVSTEPTTSSSGGLLPSIAMFVGGVFIAVILSKWLQRRRRTSF